MAKELSQGISVSDEALISTVKAYFFKFIKTRAIKYLIGLGVNMTGLVGWIATLVIDKVSKLLWKVARKIGIQIEEKIETQKELKEYENKINNSTPEDVKKAGKDFLSN